MENQGREQTKRSHLVALTTTEMISLSALVVSPWIPSEEENLKQQSTSIVYSPPPRTNKRKHSSTWRELSDLYTPTDRVAIFTGMEVVEESKHRATEIASCSRNCGDDVEAWGQQQQQKQKQG